MLEIASETENLNLENNVQKMLESKKTCRAYLHRLNFTKKRKYIDLRAPEPSSPRAFKNIEPALCLPPCDDFLFLSEPLDLLLDPV
jgi:hypothetical protein